MKDWIANDKENPPAPGDYWTCSIHCGPRDKHGVRNVYYSGGEWRRWNGKEWLGENLPTHWYGEMEYNHANS